MKAVIAGGGIGGLSAAICLRLRGWDVDVLERSSEIREMGAGLQVAANGYRSDTMTSMLRRDPIGVIASIAPWNYPLLMAAWKLASRNLLFSSTTR